MSVLEEIENKSWYVEIEPLELTADQPNSIGYYGGDLVRVGDKDEVRGEGSHQELHVFITGQYRVFWNKPNNKVRVEKIDA